MKHGTPYTYNKLKCRCPVCKAANTARAKTERAARQGKEPPFHGASGYRNYGCRCDVCVAENRIRCAEYRASGRRKKKT